MGILEINTATEAAINRHLVKHQCTECNVWFENGQLYTDKCENCCK